MFDGELTNKVDPNSLPRKDDVDCDESNSTNSFTSHLYKKFSESTTSSDASARNSNDSDGSDGLGSSVLCPDNVGTKGAAIGRTSPFSEQSTLESSTADSSKFGQSKPGSSDGDAHCGSSVSSGWSVDGSNDSLSEPSTPSSGFWEGNINFRRSRSDAPDDCAQSSSSESGGDMKSVPKSSIDQPGSTTKAILSDDGQSSPGIKKHVDEAHLPEKLCSADLKSRDSPALNFEMSKGAKVDACSNSPVLKSREIKSSSSSSRGPYANTERHSKMVHTATACSSEGSKCVATSTTSSFHALRSQEVGSLLCKDSVASAGRNISQTVKPSNGVDTTLRDSTGSSHFPSYSLNGKNGLKATMSKVVDQLTASKPSKLSGVVNETLGRYTIKVLLDSMFFMFE